MWRAGFPVRRLLVVAAALLLCYSEKTWCIIVSASAGDEAEAENHQEERIDIPSAVLHNAPTLPIQLHQRAKRGLIDERSLVAEDKNAAAAGTKLNDDGEGVAKKKDAERNAEDDTEALDERSGISVESAEQLRVVDDAATSSWQEGEEAREIEVEGTSHVDYTPKQSQARDSPAPEQTQGGQQMEEMPRLSEQSSHQKLPDESIWDKQRRVIPQKKPKLLSRASLAEKRHHNVEQEKRELNLPLHQEAIPDVGHDEETEQSLEVDVQLDKEVRQERQSENRTAEQREETAPRQSLRQQEENVEMATDVGSDKEDGEFDDRTLLDIFAEVAKEYLTQKVIKDTDAECKWDWRTLRCEPACTCTFQFLYGDYHLGRSCRRREAELEICEPTVFIQDKQVPKRILSLVRQTADILKGKIKRTTKMIVQKTANRLAFVRQKVCADLWSTIHERPAGSCWPLGTVPVPTIPERILCGRVEFPVCNSSSSGPPRDATTAPVATTAAAAARKERNNKERIFADLFEKDT